MEPEGDRHIDTQTHAHALASARIWTLSSGSTRSTSIFHVVMSVVDSIIASSALSFSALLPCRGEHGGMGGDGGLKEEEG
jgi:hypothetical protein